MTYLKTWQGMFDISRKNIHYHYHNHSTLISLACVLSTYWNSSTMTKFVIKGWNLSKLQTVITIEKVSQKSGQKYETDYFFSFWLEFASMTNGMLINTFIKTKKTSLNLCFLHYYNKSGHANYKKQCAFNVNIAQIIFTKYSENTILSTCKQ